MTNEPTPLSNLNSAEAFHFWHLGQEFLVWLSVDEFNEPTQFNIGIPKPSNGGHIAYPMRHLYFSREDVANADNFKAFVKSKWEDKVNAYFAEIVVELGLSGEAQPEVPPFPEDGAVYQWANWIAKYATEFRNGKITFNI